MRKLLEGRGVLLTGASGGLGRPMARSLHEMGARLALTAGPAEKLGPFVEELSGARGNVSWCSADIRSPDQRDRLLEWATSELGAVDILINNAGIEFTSDYHKLTSQQVTDTLRVNLEAPMMLSHGVLPAMLRRGKGHIVNISSLAGRSGPAYQEPYAASKAGLDAFTASLRATYRGTGVSASVVCPGFVEAGIYARLRTKVGHAAPAFLAGCSPQRVAQAVIRAIEKDLPEVIVNRVPVRPLLALSALSPRLGAWITRKLGVHEFFREVVESSAEGGNPDK